MEQHFPVGLRRLGERALNQQEFDGRHRQAHAPADLNQVEKDGLATTRAIPAAHLTTLPLKRKMICLTPRGSGLSRQSPTVARVKSTRRNSTLRSLKLSSSSARSRNASNAAIACFNATRNSRSASSFAATHFLYATRYAASDFLHAASASSHAASGSSHAASAA